MYIILRERKKSFHCDFCDIFMIFVTTNGLKIFATQTSFSITSLSGQNETRGKNSVAITATNVMTLVKKASKRFLIIIHL